MGGRRRRRRRLVRRDIFGRGGFRLCRLFVILFGIVVLVVVFSIVDNDLLFRGPMIIITGVAIVAGVVGVSAHCFMGNGGEVIGKEIRLVGGKAENSEGSFQRRTSPRTTGRGHWGG